MTVVGMEYARIEFGRFLILEEHEFYFRVAKT